MGWAGVAGAEAPAKPAQHKPNGLLQVPP